MRFCFLLAVFYLMMSAWPAEAGYTVYPYGRFVWQQQKAGKLSADVTVTANGLLYVPAGNKIICYDLGNGSKLWERKLELSGKITEPLLVDNGTVYAVGTDGMQQMKPNGSLTWLYRILSKPKGSKSSGVVTAGPNGLVYLGVADGLYALEPKKNFKWRFSDEKNVVAALGDSEAVYVCSGDKNTGYSLRALDARGNRLWHRGLGELKNIHLSFGPAGNLYVVTNPARLERNTAAKIMCLDRRTGKEQWTYSVRSDDLTKPAFGADNTLYFTGQHKVFALAATDGTLKWDLPLINLVSGIAVDNLNGRLYAGSSDGRLFCINTAGRLIWEKEIDKTTGQTLHKDGGIMIDTGKDEKDAIKMAPVMLPDGAVLLATDKGVLIKFIDVNKER
ncbi:PQQ-like beta-propeller repeat protein [Desulforamulus hydrothermalis]|uniref:Pyrrolo-quinoline quinone n=1 Tax=Desulforamulus hydrothermalis Lam5 = DSM 18033 TaxID=1121428 RepID=K8E0T9_9FIRM|nr:PQQ-like beta-propeller repeat protein [Desulforamulus hydrothermalis]CCO09247.1 Pyrrolo-quinoline quinone [Desulforamulus hydrothermalis Lam5 = DSM 18033]SHH05690.1 Outer membrane protein assembly factor BamB, contains PQQ-like beta-propeller repeat [Desulforamulus hydrothermalis Lam5 = DSM 18033]